MATNSYDDRSDLTPVYVVIGFLIVLSLIMLPFFDYTNAPLTPSTTTGDVSLDAASPKVSLPKEAAANH
ncbi:hypothetical protein [Siphonobacter curvatus]|nr:hypothetical protein [Siphonobacter curvatus]